MDAYLGVRFPTEMKELLEQWAAEDDRAVAYILRKLIEAEHTRRTQYLPLTAVMPPEVDNKFPVILTDGTGSVYKTAEMTPAEMEAANELSRQHTANNLWWQVAELSPEVVL